MENRNKTNKYDMNQNMKIVGILTMLLIIGLPIVNALTGYGIKGNKNLNPDVLADGSSSGSFSGSSSSEGNRIYRVTLIGISVTVESEEYTKDQHCATYRAVSEMKCNSDGTEDCSPGRNVVTYKKICTPFKI